MRFVELRPDDVDDVLEFHPRLTVLCGLDPASRVALVGFLHSVAEGETFDWSGTVEVHGIEGALASMIDLVGPTGEAAAVVDAGRLASSPEADARPEAVEHDDAVRRVVALQDEIAGLAAELAGAGRLRSEMRERITGARRAIDPDSAAALDRADLALRQAATSARRPDPWTGRADPEERIEDLRSTIEELELLLADLPHADRAPLAAALAVVRRADATGPAPVPDAMALAETWTSLHVRLAMVESRLEAAGLGTKDLAGRVESARAAARAAEEAATARAITDEEQSELEALHDVLLRAEHKAGRGLRRAASTEAFERARERFDQALAVVGYPTWAAFRMGNGLVQIAPEVVAEHAAAAERLAALEHEWSERMAALADDEELQSVLGEIDGVLEAATGILGANPYARGAPDDPTVLVDRLRDLRADPLQSDEQAREAAIAGLHDALDAAGAVGHQGLHSDAGLTALADSWLQVLASAEAVVMRADRARDRTKAELAALERADAALPSDELASERAAVEAAEGRVAESRAALLDIHRVTLELHLLAATELAVAEEHDRLVEELAEAEMAERVSRHRLEQLGGFGGVASVIDRIPRGLGGPVPVVVLLGAADASVLDRLEQLPPDVQIIVVADGDDVLAWVAGRDDGSLRCVEGAAFV